MNRITALLFAFAALLTHVLVVHRDLGGTFGAPYESVHVAFRLARNLVTEGSLHWWRDPATAETVGGLWSYPSPLLVLISSVFERLYLPVTRGVQVTGIVSVLATVWLCTRFDLTRILSVVSAVLLVSCGAVAAAGGSGTEWPIVMALATTAFVAVEKNRPFAAAISLALLAVSSAASVVLVAILFVQSLLRDELFGSPSRARRLLFFLPAAAALALAEWAGASLLHDVKRTFTWAPDDAAQGLAQLRDFLVSTVSPLLLIYPLVALFRRELSPVGRRALVIAVAWCAVTVLGGGGPLTFDLGFVPALPFAFIAIQEGLRMALDTYRPALERLAWISILTTSVGSLAVNRFPGESPNAGEQTVVARLLTPRANRWPDSDRTLGRSSLYSEVRDTNKLRRIGGFLRDRLPADATLLTPWPGAIGYLANFRVMDMLGRTDALPGYPPASWSPSPPRAHLASALSEEPEYILPWLNGIDVLLDEQARSKLPEYVLGLDPEDSPAHREELNALLAPYEPVVTVGRERTTATPIKPLLLLRRAGTFTPPEVRHRTRKGTLEFVAGFAPPGPEQPVADLPQVFDTIITAVRADGSRVVLDPLGLERATLGESDRLLTTNGLVIDPRWDDAVSLLRIPLQSLRAEPRTERLEVRLLHHRLPTDLGISDAAAPYVFEVR